jgi:formylglycine-generating enzyme required for sulfatase activity
MREVARMNAFEVLAQDPDPAVVTDADARERMKATGKPWKIRHTASGIVMLLVPPGVFEMGSAEGEQGRKDDELRHRCTIDRPFYLARTEVSQREWKQVFPEDELRDEDPAKPVDSVSWLDCLNFCSKTRGALRLPSEAEWEYACRAGSTAAYSFGSVINSDEVRCVGFAEGRGATVDCGTLPANAWGFHEMHGNLAEWCQDGYERYPVAGTQLPLDGGPEAFDGHLAEWDGNRGRPMMPRVRRGGHWDTDPLDCRSASRDRDSPGAGDQYVGFRLATH